MSKKIVSGILLLLILVFSQVTIFAFSSTVINQGDNKYKSIRLTPEIYNNANSDLSDILIKDNKGEAVPYFINTGVEQEQSERKIYGMNLLNSYVKDNNFYFDYGLSNKSEGDVLATSIEVSTVDTNFAKLVDVYGSYDNINWEFLKNDKLYAIDDKFKLNIEFDKPQKYTYYRFKLANNMEKISFDSANLVYNLKLSEESYFIEKLTPKFSVEEKDKTTLIKIEGLKNLKLCDVTIGTDSMFKRDASVPLADKEIYNLVFNNTAYTDTTIPLNWQVPLDDTYIITIYNNDDKPIDIKGITVRYYADDIVFEGSSNQNYSLEFGADDTKVAPVYDIESYKFEILKGKIDRVTIGSIIQNKTEVKEEKYDYKFIFNIVVIGTTVLLGGLTLFYLKGKPRK